MNRLLRILLILISSSGLLVAPARAFPPDRNERPSDQLIPTVDIQHVVDNPLRYLGMRIRVCGIYRVWLFPNGGEIRHRVSSGKVLWTEFGPNARQHTRPAVLDRLSRLSWNQGYDDIVSNFVLIDATGEVVLAEKQQLRPCGLVSPGEVRITKSPPIAEPCLVLDRLSSVSCASAEL